MEITVRTALLGRRLDAGSVGQTLQPFDDVLLGGVRHLLQLIDAVLETLLPRLEFDQPLHVVTHALNS